MNGKSASNAPARNPQGAEGVRRGLARRALISGIDLAPVSLALAACERGAGGQAGPPTAAAGSVELWATSEAEGMKMYGEVVAAFQTRFPGITVKTSNPSANPDNPESLLPQVAAGTTPDVLPFSPPSLAQFGPRVLTDVTTLLAKDRTLNLERDLEPAAVSFLRDWSMGKLYGLTRTLNTIVMYYNADHFAQQALPDPGTLFDQGKWTWTAALDAARTLTRRSGSETERYGWDADIEVERASAFIYQHNGSLFDKGQQKFVFAQQAEAREAIQWLLDLKDRHQVAPLVPRDTGRLGNAPEAFSRQLSSMYHDYTTRLRVIAPRAANVFKFGLVPLPTGRKPAAPATGGFVSSFKASKAPEAAWELVKFISGPEATAISLANNILVVPPRRDEASRQAFFKVVPEEQAKRLMKSMASTVPAPYVRPTVRQMWAAMTTEMRETWDGKRTVVEALGRASAEMQRLYDEGTTEMRGLGIS